MRVLDKCAFFGKIPWNLYLSHFKNNKFQNFIYPERVIDTRWKHTFENQVFIII